MKRVLFAMILTAAMGSAFAQEAAPAITSPAVVTAVAQASAPVADPAPASKSKKAPKEDRMVNGTMVGAIALGVVVVGAAVSGGGGDDKPSSP